MKKKSELQINQILQTLKINSHHPTTAFLTTGLHWLRLAGKLQVTRILNYIAYISTNLLSFKWLPSGFANPFAPDAFIAYPALLGTPSICLLETLEVVFAPPKIGRT